MVKVIIPRLAHDFGIFPSEILDLSIAAVDCIQHSTTRTHFQLTSIPETVTKVDWVCGSRVNDTKTLKTFEIFCEKNVRRELVWKINVRYV